MATDVEYLCLNCGQTQWYSLFEGLSAKASDGLKCSNCEHDLELHLTFALGFHGRVAGAFVPDDVSGWDEEEEHWEFYPFLVILESLKEGDPESQVWLPYWHKVIAKDGSVRTPFGQWAACLEIGAFNQLLRKAKEHGYLQTE
jgi:DNA-directed RNA polymerase subunit RPC12/RpoP